MFVSDTTAPDSQNRKLSASRNTRLPITPSAVALDIFKVRTQGSSLHRGIGQSPGKLHPTVSGESGVDRGTKWESGGISCKARTLHHGISGVSRRYGGWRLTGINWKTSTLAAQQPNTPQRLRKYFHAPVFRFFWNLLTSTDNHVQKPWFRGISGVCGPLKGCRKFKGTLPFPINTCWSWRSSNDQENLLTALKCTLSTEMPGRS